MTIQQQGIYKVNLQMSSNIYIICSVILLLPYRLIPNNINHPNIKSIKAMHAITNMGSFEDSINSK